MATLPDVAVTGTVIEAAWGNDVRAAVTENPAYLAAAQGDLFRATGAGAIERFPSLGPGVLAADSAGDDPRWETGSAGEYARVNDAGNALEFGVPPFGSQLITSALTTSASVTFSSLSGAVAYRLIFGCEEGSAGGVDFTLTINGLTSSYRYWRTYDTSGTPTGSQSTTATSVPFVRTANGAGVDRVAAFAAVDLMLIEDEVQIMCRGGGYSLTGPSGIWYALNATRTASSITSIALSWSYSAFATDPHARYALYRLGT